MLFLSVFIYISSFLFSTYTISVVDYLDIVVFITTGAFNSLPGVGGHFCRQHFGAFTERLDSGARRKKFGLNFCCLDDRHETTTLGRHHTVRN